MATFSVSKYDWASQGVTIMGNIPNSESLATKGTDQ
jgi:hypothetical protein